MYGLSHVLFYFPIKYNSILLLFSQTVSVISHVERQPASCLLLCPQKACPIYLLIATKSMSHNHPHFVVFFLTQSVSYPVLCPHTVFLISSLLSPYSLFHILSHFYNKSVACPIFNRPGVAGAVLQTPLLPTDSLSDGLRKYFQYTFTLKP